MAFKENNEQTNDSTHNITYKTKDRATKNPTNLGVHVPHVFQKGKQLLLHMLH